MLDTMTSNVGNNSNADTNIDKESLDKTHFQEFRLHQIIDFSWSLYSVFWLAYFHERNAHLLGAFHK